MNIREQINLIKFKENMSQEDVAKALYVNKTYISVLISGKRTPSAKLQRKIYKLFPYCNDEQKDTFSQNGDTNIMLNQHHIKSNNVNVTPQSKINQENITIEYLQEKIKLLQEENSYLREQNKTLMEQQNKVLLEILKERRIREI